MNFSENMLRVNASLKAFGGHIEGFDKNAGENLLLVKEINDRTKTIHQEAKDANQEHKAGLETIDSHLECVGKNTNESLPLVKDVDIRTRSIHQEVKVAARENRSSFQTLGSHVDDLHDLTNHSVPLIRELDQRTQNIHSNLQLVRPSIQDSERKIESIIKSEISGPLAELQASLAGLTALMTTKEAHLTEVVSLYGSAHVTCRLIGASKHTNRLLHELNINFSASRASCGQLAIP